MMKGAMAKLLAGAVAVIIATGLLVLFGSSDAHAGPLPDLPPLDCPDCKGELCDGIFRCVLTNCEEECTYACAVDFTCRF